MSTDQQTATATPTKPQKPAVFGMCSVAQTMGKVRGMPGQGDPDAWHAKCPGLIADNPYGRLRITQCSCNCGHTTGVLCTLCKARKPLLGAPDVPAMACVDPESGTCVDGEACASLMQRKQDESELAQQLRAIKQEAADRRKQMSDTATEKPARQPARPKEGACQHCGEKTRGGLFVAGHDAKLKGDLGRVYTNREASRTERVDALAEGLARSWVKPGTSAYDLPKLMKGVKEETDKQAISDEWDSLLKQAQEQIRSEGGPELIQRRVKARTGG